MKKSLLILAAAAFVLTAVPALSGQPAAGEVMAVDEWNQPVMVDGAKGVPVQATQQADYRGAEKAIGHGGNAGQFANDGNWLEAQDSFEPGPMVGSEHLNR